jgi:T4 RNA ligase 2 C-terminal
MEECLSLQVDEAETGVPAALGLPRLPQSVIAQVGLSEGVVVRPLVEREVPTKGKFTPRAIVKHKSRKFLEVSRQKAVDPTFPGDEARLEKQSTRAARHAAERKSPEDAAWDELLARLNENRLHAVLSKQGRLPARPSNLRIRRVATTLVQDALASVREEEPDVWKYVSVDIQEHLQTRAQPEAERVVREGHAKDRK